MFLPSSVELLALSLSSSASLMPALLTLALVLPAQEVRPALTHTLFRWCSAFVISRAFLARSRYQPYSGTDITKGVEIG